MRRQKPRWYAGFPWYTLLFAIYPPLNLLAHNIGEVGYAAANRAFLIIVVGAVLSVLFLNLFLKDWQKTGFLFVILAFLFYSYGFVHAYLEESTSVTLSFLGRHRYLAPTWLFLALAGFFVVLRSKLVYRGTVSVLSVVAIVLVVFPSMQLVSFAFATRDEMPASSQGLDLIGSPASPSTLPDIYYIILDGYGRSDILKKRMGFDNAEFLEQLGQDGFYVAACAQSNYAQTAISLASSLNMNYLDALGDDFVPGNKNRYGPLWELIENNVVKDDLRRRGYKVVAFETGYHWTEFHDADYYYESPQTGVTGFESLLLRNSGTLFLDYLGLFDRFRLTPEDQKRQTISYVLDKLPEIPKLPGPKFVFVHLVIPHQPFVFGPDGEALAVAPGTLSQDANYTSEDYRNGYRNQAIYISKRIPELMRDIIEGSSSPLVIVIQGDHGPSHFGKRDRMSILNAYYFSGAQPKLYPSITPVNTFRMIFNAYFDANLEILPDRSYYSRYATPYEFGKLPNKCVVP